MYKSIRCTREAQRLW